MIVVLSAIILITAGYLFLNKEQGQNNNPTVSPAIKSTWVDEFIKKEEASPVANPPASLTKCTYKNQTVYYLPARCCDIPSVVYDDKGQAICSPGGGLTGKGDGKCADFLTSRTDCVTIWKDSRGKR